MFRLARGIGLLALPLSVGSARATVPDFSKSIIVAFSDRRDTMLRLAHRMGVLIVLVLALFAGPAWAVVIDQGNSTLVGIQLLPADPPEPPGATGIQTHTPLHMNVVIRDQANSPVPNVVVRVDFGGCCGAGGMFFTDSQPGIHGPNGVYNAAGKFFEQCTGSDGDLDYSNGAGGRFWVRGNALNPPPGGLVTPVITPCAMLTVYNQAAGGACTKGTVAYTAPINIAAADQDQANGINSGDATRFIGDRDNYPLPRNAARSDFNGSGAVNPADGAIMLAYFLPLKYVTSAGPPYTVCP